MTFTHLSAALVTDAIQPSISLQARTIQCACAAVRIVLCRFIEGLDVCALDTDPCPRSRDWSYCALISQGAGLSCLWPLTPHYLLTPVPQVWRAKRLAILVATEPQARDHFLAWLRQQRVPRLLPDLLPQMLATHKSPHTTGELCKGQEVIADAAKSTIHSSPG